MECVSLLSQLSHLRSVRWRIFLCNMPSYTFVDLRRAIADSRRRSRPCLINFQILLGYMDRLRIWNNIKFLLDILYHVYAALRRRLLVDPYISKDGSSSPNLVMDNPLSESLDSMWGRFFRNAELEILLDQDLSRLYPEHGCYFQTLGCQYMLRRILLLWCLRHPKYGYRQGMHEILAPLLYVVHADLQQLTEASKLHEDHFTDKIDDAFSQQHSLPYNFELMEREDASSQEKTKRIVKLDELDPEIQTIVLLSDPFGAEGELGVVLSEKFMEHDVYCMFDALMSGRGGAVAMAEFFSPSATLGSQTGLSPVIEASSALYLLLSVVDSSLHNHLIELGAEPQYFALRWLRVLFGREFRLEGLLRTWDEIFSYDNVKLSTSTEDEPGSSSRVLSSRIGAFICAMAISMMLSLRSSLLAMETATSCLQRLLNFPDNIDLGKVIEKAKSLLPLALDAANGSHDNIKKSVDFASSTLISAPERYWEEKWRDVHKEEEVKEDGPGEGTPKPQRGWTESKQQLVLPETSSTYSNHTNSLSGKFQLGQKSTTLVQVELTQEHNGCQVPLKGGNYVMEHSLICTLRNLGQSMMDNIQVIESVLNQGIRQPGSIDNMSKKTVMEKGQITAVSALKELRKMSNLLSEI